MRWRAPEPQAERHEPPVCQVRHAGWVALPDGVQRLDVTLDRGVRFFLDFPPGDAQTAVRSLGPVVDTAPKCGPRSSAERPARLRSSRAWAAYLREHCADEIVAAYVEGGEALWDIGQRYGVAYQTIRALLQDSGVAIRRPGQPRKGQEVPA